MIRPGGHGVPFLCSFAAGLQGRGDPQEDQDGALKALRPEPGP